MLSPSLALLALTGVMAVSSASTQPTWHRDYATAVSFASQQAKPLAVFVARGEGGVPSVLSEGSISKSTSQVLKDHYVCLVIDAESDRGKELASAFELTEGMVISDRTLDKQAFRHVGRLQEGTLNRALVKYAQPALSVSTTEVEDETGAITTQVLAPTTVSPMATTPAVIMTSPQAVTPGLFYPAPVCRT